LCGPIASWHVSKCCSAHASTWPLIARQESLTAAILRCASARVGAASIAFGFQIAIEAAVVAELENSKEK
jgi:hypothetical protein